MDSTSTLIAKGFLLFSDATLIVPILVGGFLLQKNKVLVEGKYRASLWVDICLLVLFTMIFNVLLKSIFMVPLNPALGKEGFAFPSGHMQVSTVCYGALFLAYRERFLRVALILIIAEIGAGLIHMGYHALSDVLAAFIVGVGTLYAFVKIKRMAVFQERPYDLAWYFIPLTGIMMGIIAYRTTIPVHLFGAFFGLMFISMGLFAYLRPKR